MTCCEIKILSAGDSALVVQFGNCISKKINNYIRIFVEKLEQEVNSGALKGILEWVPTFRSVSIYFDPFKISQKKLSKITFQLAKKIISQTVMDITSEKNRVHEVPVCYDSEFAPDMETVCENAHLSKEQVIKIHSSTKYLIYMLGFLPGFVYLGGMDKSIETPRLQSPRLKIDAGSVGIAGSQTGIYPLESPGGWQLIGRTPVKLFDFARKNPVLFKSGDYIKFKPISHEQYKDLVEKLSVSTTSVSNKITVENNNFITVVNSGAQTSIQDQGRYGYQKDGFSPSGVMDFISYKLANAIAGNEKDYAVLETTMLGPKIFFGQDTFFAITGGDQQPRLNDQQIPLYTQVFASAGSTLTLGFTVTGLRSYIAFKGGLDVPLILGSRSTSIKYSLGGFEGRCLSNNDKIPIGENSSFNNYTLPISVPSELLTAGNPIYSDSKTSNAAKRHLKDLSGVQVLRVILGPQDDYFSRKSISVFTSSEYTVSGESDRMGLRLTGPFIKTLNGSDIISDGIAYGSIQVTSSGQPIIMAADRQTTGGYAKIGTVITADLPLLGQLKPGTKLQFKKVSIKQAVKALKHKEKVLNFYIRKLQRDNNYNLEGRC